VEDGVAAALPALIDEPPLVPAGALDELVAIEIAELVDPAQRRLDVRPDRAQRLDIAGALVIGSSQHDEERRRRDTAEVEAERHLAEDRHLAVALLMQDLSGLGVDRGVAVSRLRRRQIAQHAAGDGGIDPQHHQRGDYGIAAENRAVPGYARIRVE